MFIAKAEITIDAATSEVWDALINPDKIKVYMFGTNAVSDWKAGSPIKYKGVWEGKEYEDGGTIIKLEPEKVFESTYWSSMSGTEDKPENYVNVKYELAQNGKGTLLTVTQDKCRTLESKEHSENNWNMVLGAMKELIEKK